MVYKCVIWGTGKTFWRELNLIKYHELCNRIKIIAVTSKEADSHLLKGYPHILPKELALLQYDFIIVMTEKTIYHEIVKDAVQYNINVNKIIFWEVFSRNEIDFDNYVSLRQNPVSIFANICWGGLTYNALNLQFSSPFINLYVNERDYLKFLNNPHLYLEADLKCKKYEKNEELGIMYPVVQCMDIELHFNHYPSFEEAELCWKRRKNRINWNNIFVMMSTENYDAAVEFAKLPYNKKVCFVPFEPEEPCWCRVNFRDASGQPQGTGRSANWVADRKFVLYDDIHLLCTGKLKAI